MNRGVPKILAKVIPLRKPKGLPDCKACGGSGYNSKGGDCYPCKVNKERQEK